MLMEVVNNLVDVQDIRELQMMSVTKYPINVHLMELNALIP